MSLFTKVFLFLFAYHEPFLQNRMGHTCPLHLRPRPGPSLGEGGASGGGGVANAVERGVDDDDETLVLVAGRPHYHQPCGGSGRLCGRRGQRRPGVVGEGLIGVGAVLAYMRRWSSNPTPTPSSHCPRWTLRWTQPAPSPKRRSEERPRGPQKRRKEPQDDSGRRLTSGRPMRRRLGMLGISMRRRRWRQPSRCRSLRRQPGTHR